MGMPLTLKAINAELAKRGHTARLEKAGPYFYFFDDGVEFGRRELRGIDVVGEGENAASGAGLDDVGAVFDVVAHGLPGLVRATDDAVRDAGFAAEDVGGEARRGIAMAAGGAQRVNGHQDARAGD